MNKTIVDKIEELFGHPEKFTAENLENLVQEAIRFFTEMKTSIESPDIKVREEALKLADSLKTKLHEQAYSLCEAIGMDPETIESYINTATNFSPEEWQAMEKARSELEDYKNAISKMQSETTPSSKTVKNKKPKTVKEWLVG